MTKIKCGYGDCEYSHELSKVVGSHRRRVHGLTGVSHSAKARQKRGGITIKAEVDPLQCTQCEHKPFGSKHGLQYHMEHSHGVGNKNGHKKGVGPVVSLSEAIDVLQIEVDTMVGVIAKLKQLQGGRF